MRTVFILIICVMWILPALADSPLTSTMFYKVYDHKMINKALANRGKINDEICSFLLKYHEPIEIRFAVINALGWKIGGKNNASVFLKYIINNKKYSTETDFLVKGTNEELMLYAYLAAMDNYFDVSKSKIICNDPRIRNDKSRCIQIIAGLINAQDVKYGNWCDIYEIMNEARDNEKCINDMNEDAMILIFNYVDIYKKYCQNLITSPVLTLSSQANAMRRLLTASST